MAGEKGTSSKVVLAVICAALSINTVLSAETPMSRLFLCLASTIYSVQTFCSFVASNPPYEPNRLLMLRPINTNCSPANMDSQFPNLKPKTEKYLRYPFEVNWVPRLAVMPKNGTVKKNSASHSRVNSVATKTTTAKR